MKTQFFKTILAIAFVVCSSVMLAQGPPNPPGVGHGGTGDQPAGGGAPIGSGIGILLALGATYGAAKFYQTRKDETEPEV